MSAMPSRAASFCRPSGLGEAAAARAADDRYDEPGAQRRVLVQQQRDRAQQDVGGLQRLDAAGEERDQRVLRQTEPGPGGGAAVARAGSGPG